MVTTQDPTLPAWKGLFEWSIKNTADGTRPTRAPTPEELAWFQQAMAANVQDVAQRMRDIKIQLEQPPEAAAAPTLEQREDLLDELLEIVEDINFARDLRGVGGLPVLLSLLADPAPGLRARAAAVLGACGQNNAPVQQWLLDGGALAPLLNQLTDSDGGARAAALTAVSCLVRGHRPAIAALLQAGGLAAVAGGLSDALPRVQRKAAQLLGALCAEGPPGTCGAAAGPCGAAAALPRLLGSAERDSREAGLRLALALVADSQSAASLFQVPDFETSLRRLHIALSDAPAADAEAAADEKALLSRLEAASLGGGGGDPAAAAAAGSGADGGGGGGTSLAAAAAAPAKEEPVLLLGPPPPA